jgi:hypothetical protein
VEDKPARKYPSRVNLNPPHPAVPKKELGCSRNFREKLISCEGNFDFFCESSFKKIIFFLLFLKETFLVYLLTERKLHESNKRKCGFSRNFDFYQFLCPPCKEPVKVLLKKKDSDDDDDDYYSDYDEEEDKNKKPPQPPQSNHPTTPRKSPLPAVRPPPTPQHRPSPSPNHLHPSAVPPPPPPRTAQKTPAVKPPLRPPLHPPAKPNSQPPPKTPAKPPVKKPPVTPGKKGIGGGQNVKRKNSSDDSDDEDNDGDDDDDDDEDEEDEQHQRRSMSQEAGKKPHRNRLFLNRKDDLSMSGSLRRSESTNW